LVPATSQITFKLYNPKTKKTIWKSVNASGFKSNGRSCKSDQFEIKHTGTPTTEETYLVTANLDKTTQISLKFTKPASAPGFKLGDGPHGGISIFGKDQEDGKRDGIVVHRFHPLVKSSGSLMIDGQVYDATGEAMFVGAIQGMRPDSVASRWNFAFFTSGGGNENGKFGDVRAVQMELETTDQYGSKGPKSGRTKVNIGAVYTSEQSTPLFVTGQTYNSPSATPFPKVSDDVSTATHLSTGADKETGYSVPLGVAFEWQGKRIDGKGQASAKVVVDKLGLNVGEGGLIEKVDVLAEIPYVIRKGLAAVTGTKPFLYQYLNPATLELNVDEEVVPVKGWLFSEATFVSA